MTFIPNFPPPPKLTAELQPVEEWMRRLNDTVRRTYLNQKTTNESIGDCCPELLPAYDLGSVADASETTEDYGAVAAPVTALIDLGSVAS